MGPLEVESGWSWTQGLRPSRAVLLEVVRLVVAAFLVVNLVFAAFFLSPPLGPGLSFTPHDPKYAGIAAYNRELYALDRPLATQYVVFLGNAFTGNLGLSYFYRTPVTDLVLTALPVTFELTIGTLLWALVLGGLLGWAASSRRLPQLRRMLEACGSVLYGLPVFAAVLLLALYADLGLGSRLAPTGPFPPRVTGFYTLDALLSGNLEEFWLAFWTTAVLTLPAGAAFALPVLHRVRQGVEARRPSPEFADPHPSQGRPLRAFLRAAVVPMIGAVGVLLPFAFAASFFAELVSIRRGVGWALVLAFNNLDAPLFLGTLLLPCLIVLLVAAPFTLFAAGLTRRPRAPSPSMGLPLTRPRPRFAAAAQNLARSRGLLFWVGIALVTVPIGASLAAPVLAPLGPLVRVAPVGSPCTAGIDCPLSPPSPEHLLGVDFYGMDILAQVLWGGLYLLETVAVAACMAVGLGLVLGLLASPLGRAVDLPARAVLGGLAALPVVILLWLLITALPFSLALGLVFIPVVFRDVRDPGESAAVAAKGPPPRLLRLRGWSERVDSGGTAGLPRLLLRLPRRLAEMALLAESLSFLFYAAVGPTDWAAVISRGLAVDAIDIGNPGWIWAPFLLLFVLAAGLLLVSDGLRAAADVGPPPALIPVSPGPAQLPPFPRGNP